MQNVLGIFAKQPVAGRVKTRLGEQIGFEAAAELYESFLRDILGRFENTADRRVLGIAPDTSECRHWFAQFDSKYELWAQPDQSLGGRIQAFFGEYCGETSRVVLIGSDSPSLPTRFIADAFAALDNHACVIGPASDGGYYLIGLAADAVSAGLFEGIEWSTSSVFKQTIAKIAAAELTLSILPIWYDVDSTDSLELLAGHIAGARLDADQSPLVIDDLPATTNWLLRNGY